MESPKNNAEHQDEFRLSSDRTLNQRHQRQGSALAIVIRAQQHEDVFDRDDDDQRPQDHRQYADDNFGRHRTGVACGRRRGFAEGIERRRSDVAEHDADAAERQRPHADRVAGGAALGGRHILMSHELRLPWLEHDPVATDHARTKVRALLQVRRTTSALGGPFVAASKVRGPGL
jgi:hypothetical protein